MVLCFIMCSKETDKPIEENMTLSSVVIGIKGMTCNSCAKKIESAISAESGVHSVVVSIVLNPLLPVLPIESSVRFCENAKILVESENTNTQI